MSMVDIVFGVLFIFVAIGFVPIAVDMAPEVIQDWKNMFRRKERHAPFQRTEQAANNLPHDWSDRIADMETRIRKLEESRTYRG